MYRICPHSGEEFIPKRRNQVFATSKNRRDYHNNNMSELRVAKGAIDKILQKNFIILRAIVPNQSQTTIISVDELLRKGFNPHAFTHIVLKNGTSERYLYDFKIKYIGNQVSITNFTKND